MPKFIIEREMPGAGTQSPDQLRDGAAHSNAIIRELGPGITWLMSYITDNKIFCVFVAPDEDILREHAQCVRVPADRISRVVTITDPSTAE